MGTYNSMKLLALAALLAVLLFPLVQSSTSLCRSNQYWHEARELCINCSTCKEPGHIVLRPCQVHQDALCGPLHALNIDWSWLGSRYASNSSSSYAKNVSHKHSPKKQHGHSSKWASSSESSSSYSSSSSSTSSEHYKRRYHERRPNGGKHHNHHHHHHHNKNKLRPPESAAQLKEQDAVSSDRMEAMSGFQAPLAPDAQRSQQQEPFTTTETLVWDWQAVVLVLAVLACVLFFISAALYGVQQARRDSYRADAEDLSATLSLMVPGVTSDSLDHGGPTTEGCNSNQCLYMDQLLVRKQQDEPGEEKGNVYINRDKTSSPRV